VQLSAKSDYAFRALFFLAENTDRGPCSIREIAETNDIPRRFLEHIMLDLKDKGWVRSISGRHGGYVLAKKPEEITMGEVVRHFDSVLAPIGCVSVNKYKPCSQEAHCRFRNLMLQIRNQVADLMDTTTIASGSVDAK
jgi:Rrf2 family protein